MSVLRIVGRSAVFGALAAGGMVTAVRVIDPVAAVTPIYETALGFGALVFCYAVLTALLAQAVWALLRAGGPISRLLSAVAFILAFVMSLPDALNGISSGAGLNADEIVIAGVLVLPLALLAAVVVGATARILRSVAN